MTPKGAEPRNFRTMYKMLVAEIPPKNNLNAKFCSNAVRDCRYVDIVVVKHVVNHAPKSPESKGRKRLAIGQVHRILEDALFSSSVPGV